MIRIYLILLVIIIAFFGIRAFLKTSPAVLARYIKSLLAIRYRPNRTLFGRNRTFELAFCAGRRDCRLCTPIDAGIITLCTLFAPAMVGIQLRQNRIHRNVKTKRILKANMSVEEAYEVLGLKDGCIGI